MYAIIAAGGAPQPGEQLFDLTHGKNKALLEICDKSMIQWELDALGESKLIQGVFIIGLPPSISLQCSHPLFFVETNGSMLENVRIGAHAILVQDPKAKYSLLLSSDIPAISSEIVDWMIKIIECDDYDVYYSVVEKTIMEQRYPVSRRTYSQLRDIELCGGDMHGIRLEVASRDNPLWNRILQARKNPFKQAALVGVDTLFNFVFRRLTLKDAEIFISNKLGIHGKAVLCPFAEIGMDVDKPFQYEIMQKELALR